MQLRQVLGIATRFPTFPEVEQYGRFRDRVWALASELGQSHNAFASHAASFLYIVLPCFLRSAVEFEGLQTPAPEERSLLKSLFERYGVSDWSHPYTMTLRVLAYKRYRDVPFHQPSLEIAMGNGITSNFVFQDKRFTVGSDPGIFSVLEAKNLCKHKHFMAFDASSIPFPDETFSTLCALYPNFHADAKRQVIAEAARVLRPGGVLALDDMTQDAISMRPLGTLYRAFGFHSLFETFERSVMGSSGGGFLEDPIFYARTLEEAGFERITIEWSMSKGLTNLLLFFYDWEQALKVPFASIQPSSGFSELYLRFLEEVLAPLIARDREICNRERKGGWVHIRAFKKGSRGAELPEEKAMEGLECPQCRNELSLDSNAYRCGRCQLDFPILSGVPLLIPVYATEYRSVRQGKT